MLELYRKHLQRHIEATGDDVLEQAYRIGRDALARGEGILDLLEVHRTVVAMLPEPQDAARIHAFLLECLAPFELAQRGYKAALATATQQLKYIFETLDVVFFSIEHPAIKTLLFSPGCFKIYGLPPERFFDDPLLWRSLIVAEDHHLVDGTWPDMMAGRSIEVQYRIRRADGEVRWLEAYVKPTLDAAGALARVDGIVSDVTDRVRRQQYREASLAVSRILAECNLTAEAAEPIVTALGRTLGWRCGAWWEVDPKRGLRCLFGASEPPQHVLERRSIEISAPGQPMQVAFPVQIDGEMVAVLELWGGDRRLLEPYELEQLVSIGSQIGSFLQRRRAEQALRDSEARLRQAQRMEAVGQLAGGVAHDFNNLLTAIIGYSDMALESLDPDHEVREDLLEVRRAGERAAELTRQLLAFSRRQALQPRILDVNTVIPDMERMLRRIIGEHIDLKTVLDPSIGVVKVDPGQLEQVIVNLSVNARDAMPQGGKLTIETAEVAMDEAIAERNEVTPGVYVMLALTDSGCGMDADTLTRIFEPFFTTKENGTGLGLATVFGIVKQSGGHLSVYSEPGHGTTFRVYLPRVATVAPQPALALPLVPSRGHETLLLVEDDAMVRSLTRNVLKRAGYRILEASGPAEAIAICAKPDQVIDLMISDVVMPEMSGMDLARRLRQDRHAFRVLLMSGYTGTSLSHQRELDPGIPFLDKPFTPSELLRKVQEVLETNPD